MNPPSEAVGIAIFSRSPIPGATKRRLIPALGPEGAAALHRWLLRRTVRTASAAAVGPVTLWCQPDFDHPEFRACRALGATHLRSQPEGDLGERMRTAIAAGLPGATVVIGSDCPGYTPALLREAAAALIDHDAVLVPAEDGGYALIGLRADEPAVFAGIEWGGAAVLATTRDRLRRLGWSWRELPTLWDVDRPADASRLVAEFPDAPVSPSEFP